MTNIKAVDVSEIEKLKQSTPFVDGSTVDVIHYSDLIDLLDRSPSVSDDVRKDAERWRKGVEDKEFGVYSNGQYIHFSRKDGKMIFGKDHNELMDNVIAHDQAIDKARE